MGIQIETHRVVQFADAVQLLAQQKGSKLRPLVDEYPLKGKAGSIDTLGKVTPQRRQGRHQDTRLSETSTYRRWYFADIWDWAELIENEDKKNMVYDPTSKLAQNAGFAFARLIDQVIVNAAFADVITGEERNGTLIQWNNTNYPNQIIAHGSVGLNLTKLRNVKKRFSLNDENENGQIIGVISPQQLDDLLGETSVTSADYNNVKALVHGEVDTFMGIRFVVSNLLAKDSTNAYRRCIFFNTPALGFVEQKAMERKVSERPDKNYNTQLFLSTMVGAVRCNETGIMEVQCTDAT